VKLEKEYEILEKEKDKREKKQRLLGSILQPPLLLLPPASV
jgi:hypothetical protein